MENKYFTPNIEDIHVGYECEIQREITNQGLWARIQQEKPEFSPRWDKVVVGKELDKSGEFTLELFEKTLEEMFYPNPSVDKCKFYINHSKLRVPHLTKEQILAEGWREIHYREYLSPDNKIHFFNGEKEKKDDDEYKSVFSINNGKYGDILFSGSCKDINTFRQIFKNIK